MQYSVQELADKFKFAANKFIEDKELDEQQKKLNENDRYDKAYKEMLKCKPIFTISVGRKMPPFRVAYECPQNVLQIRMI